MGETPDKETSHNNNNLVVSGGHGHLISGWESFRQEKVPTLFCYILGQRMNGISAFRSAG